MPLGITAAVRQDSWIDHACRVVSTTGVSLPVFFTGLLLVYAFYFVLGWAPAPLGRLDVFFSAPPHVTGFYLIDSVLAREWSTFRAALAQLILPAAHSPSSRWPPIARITRGSMWRCSPRIRATARASGLKPKTVDRHLCVPQRHVAVITTLAWCSRSCSPPTCLVEKVFAWPGIGSYAVEALLASDFAPVQGFVLTMRCFRSPSTSLIDILYGVSTRA